MPYIGNTPAEKYAAFDVQYFTTSATTSYTLDHAVANELDIRLVINNVIQEPGSGKAYTASGTTLTLSAATAGTDTMYCVYTAKASQTVNPPAGSVGPSQIANNAVDLTSKVTGTLPIANGGTGSTATTFVNATTNITGVVPAANLGTGTASSSTVLYGDGTFKAEPGGGLVHITSQAFPSANNFTIDNVFSADYENYIMIISMLNCTTDDSCDFVWVKSGTPDTGSNYGFTSRGYDYQGNSHSTYSNGITTYGNLTYNMDADTEAGASGVYNIISPYAAYQRKHIFGTQANQLSTANTISAWYTANSYHNGTTQQFTGIKFQSRIGHNFRAGSVSGGYSSVSIYGVKNS